MSAPTAGAEARRFGRSAGMLSAGVGAAGVLTQAYFALASPNLDRPGSGSAGSPDRGRARAGEVR